MSFNFVHLRVHSEYSLVDGLIRIDELVLSVSLNMPAVAITDHCNLFALVKFYREALNSGVKPIVGADILLKNPQDQTVTKASLLCQNQEGYKNLTRLISKAYLEGQANDQAVIQWDWLAKANEGLIVLSGAREGDIGRSLLMDKPSDAKAHLQRWMETFPNRFYIELQRTGRDQEEAYLQAALVLAEEFSVPVVATNDVRFLNADEFEAHEARVCIRQSQVLDDQSRARLYSDQQYLRSPEEMQTLFSDIPEALANTVLIAERCSVELTLGQNFLPRFPLPEGVVLENYFKVQSEEGLEIRLRRISDLTPERREEYAKRLTRELDVINRMGFGGYFLIVADFIRWAKNQKIPVGPGRGSGAGSLVAYALGITELDPLIHELLFERFLNPERISMPDFDIDFCMERRDRVIDYVADRYGRDCVAQIITYGTMAAKAVVRDVGRVLSLPYGFVDKIAKLIPFEIGMTLEKALDQEEQLQTRYDNEDEVRTLIDLARKLEGLARNAGKHAGGVVIAPTLLTDFTPLYCEPGAIHVVSQFDKDDVEAVGLVKFDFLGLRTLTIIDWALQTINAKRRAEQLPEINIDEIPLDDAKSFDLLKACATSAVFQLESRGMKDLVRRIQPDRFEDITALVALFRPGPLQSGMVDDFINRKHGLARVEYPHPDLEPILNTTYGVILYQEQVMQIAQNLAGYSLGGADILRRAMGKKKPEEMAKQREIFVAGAKERGIAEQISAHIFDLMEKFAGYGFNKSHSAAYALIAYQTAWLKAHYPAEFMAAVLSSDMDNTDKVVGFIEEAKRMQLSLLPPNLATGFYHFTVSPQGEIVFGLGAVKGVGEAAVNQLVEERDKNGPYLNFFDFCQRQDTRKLNRRALEALIRSGAMDCFKVDRAKLMASIDKALKLVEQTTRNQEQGQVDLFGQVEEHAPTTAPDYVEALAWTDLQRLKAERETVGFYFSGHPLAAYEHELKQLSLTPLSELSKMIGRNVLIAALVFSVRTIVTKRGKKMAIVTLEDQNTRVDVTVFGEIYDTVREEIIKDQVVIVKGEAARDDFNGGMKIMAESATSLASFRKKATRRLVISLENETKIEDHAIELGQLLKPYRGGRCPVVILYQDNQARAELALGPEWRVNLSDELLAEAASRYGRAAVRIEY